VDYTGREILMIIKYSIESPPTEEAVPTRCLFVSWPNDSMAVNWDRCESEVVVVYFKVIRKNLGDGLEEYQKNSQSD
jgi:hypothetical protein